MKKYRERSGEKYTPRPETYKEFIEISLSLGESLEIIGKRIKVKYETMLSYCNREGLLEKYKRRSWTHKDENPRKRYTIARKSYVKQGVLRDIPD